jgi:hypothetical protein
MSSLKLCQMHSQVEHHRPTTPEACSGAVHHATSAQPPQKPALTSPENGLPLLLRATDPATGLLWCCSLWTYVCARESCCLNELAAPMASGPSDMPGAALGCEPSGVSSLPGPRAIVGVCAACMHVLIDT